MSAPTRGISAEFQSEDPREKYPPRPKLSQHCDAYDELQFRNLQMNKSSHQPFLKQGFPRESALVGAPPGFDFLAALRQARLVRAAIAFGHMTGWKKVEAALRNPAAQRIQILLGQSFLQTEPDLLDILLAMQGRQSNFHVKLAPMTPTFHPKVWLIEDPTETQAIVGSANLSFGGFASNTECSGYFNDPGTTNSLTNWFEAQWIRSLPLTLELCRTYRQKYEKIVQARDKAKAAIKDASSELANVQAVWKRNVAIAQANSYFSSADGKASAKQRIAAMGSIRKLLKPPTFKFTETDWLQFLTIHEFGSMKRIRRDTTQSLPAIRKAFLYLSDNSISLATRIDEAVLVGGKYHVPGIGLNIATKVLAMHNPKTMGVFNKAVRDTLRSFGYKVDPKKSLGEQYVEFCREMLSFVKSCGQSELLSIDAFFDHYFHGQ